MTTEQTTGLHFHNGEWIALTHSASKTFKTERAATAWLVRRGYDIDGSRLP